MDFIIAGLFCIVLLLFLMAASVPIALSFLLSGTITGVLMLDFTSTISLLGQSAYYSVAIPTWACIPLFMLMGSFAAAVGLARRAYDGIYAITKGLPGSLAVTTCFSCALFGATSGSSLATTAIFGKMALPEMNRYGYDKGLSVGCIASAGTFASMIPPSLMMIIYALYTEQSVGKLFAAGIIPGLMTAAIYVFIIVYRVKRNPELAPAAEVVGEPLTIKQKSKEALQLWPVIVIAAIVFGGIYSGLFTPTESAAAGALITLLFGFLLKSIRSFDVIISSMKESASTTSMLFLIIIGALFYSRILALTDLPNEMAGFLLHWNMHRVIILSGVLALMFILGMIMVPVGIYALTLPIVFPLIVKLGYDPIWFGVICLKLTEIGSITPPVGLNVYAAKGVIPEDAGVSLEDIFRGIWPFVIGDLIVLIILIISPELTTWLPNLLLG